MGCRTEETTFVAVDSAAKVIYTLKHSLDLKVFSFNPLFFRNVKQFFLEVDTCRLLFLRVQH